MPLTPGNWVYSVQGGNSQALFGPAAGQAAFIVRCDRAQRQISLGREGATGTVLTVRSTSDVRSLPATVRAQPSPYLWAALPANDRLLDSLAFSRGRFTVEATGLPVLVIPSWPEPARVIEDCRG
jgi:hypothetical protein